MSNTFDGEKTVDFLGKHLSNHERLLAQTAEIKVLLLDGDVENQLETRVKNRGLLINEIATSEQHFISLVESFGVGNRNFQNLKARAMVQKIQKLLKEIESLDKEVTTLVRDTMDDINKNLAKIQDTKQLVNNLKEVEENSPTFIDIRG